MEITKIGQLTIVVLGILLMAGCSTTPAPSTGEEETKSVERVEMPDTNYSIRNGKLVVDGDMLDGLFYFDFDQSIIKRAGHVELNTHAQALSKMSGFSVRLEGHADERGTREYNNALGERRANAVRSYLMSQGVSSSQIEVISYGEEKPVVGGSNERSWALNRRVEIVYR